ncbi:MAG: TetR/AcrR family transcriptional regulator [Leptolyngbyaceae cyanobacterium SU_3_3]|nr:TetR/AcrR family transcriptional regulator [Leptolyngbyaceae cyanobacterium SU_3_3]
MNSEPAKPDLRVKRSRKLLRDALLVLIPEKKYDAISVQEICDRAMVHRTTFYKHYEGKDGLLRSLIQEIYDELATKIPTPDVVLATASYDKLAAHLIQIFIHIAEYKIFYKAMLSGSGVGVFRLFLRDQMVKRVLSRIRLLTKPDEQLPVPELIMAQYTAGALINVITWWVEQEMPYSPEQMALYVTRLWAYGVYPVFSLDPHA